MPSRTQPVTRIFTIVLFTAFAALSHARAATVAEVISKPYTNIAHTFGDSAEVELSADGRWAAFNSSGSGLATNDNNGLKIDVFLKDLQSGATTLITRNSEGQSANGDSVLTGLSGDGRFVVFESDADDLVADDENEGTDVFLFNRESGTASLLSRSTNGIANGDSGAAGITRNGQFILFESNAEDLSPLDTNGTSDLFLLERTSGNLQLVSMNAANTAAATSPAGPTVIGTYNASASEDGRYVAFLSTAENLVKGVNPSNSDAQLFLRDMVAGTNQWISQTPTHIGGRFVSLPQLSTNGSMLAFLASGLAGGQIGTTDLWLLLYARESNVLSSVPVPLGISGTPLSIDEFSLSANGRFVAYTLGGQVYRYDIASASTLRVSSSTNGIAGSGVSSAPVLSDEGSILLFTSTATNLVEKPFNEFSQLYSFDAAESRLTLLTPGISGTGGGNRDILFPVLSADGSKAGFTTYATDLVTNDDKFANDVFTVPTSGKENVQLASAPLTNIFSATADGPSDAAPGGISGDGRWVVFTSFASDVVPDDDNNASDVFLRDRTTGTTGLISVSADRMHPLPGGATLLGFSVDARRIAFSATNGSISGIQRNLYIYDRVTGTNSVGNLLPNGDATAFTEGTLSQDGRYLAFRVASGGAAGVYVRDLDAGLTRQVPASLVGSSLWGISPGSKYLLFTASLSTLRLVDWQAGTNLQLSAISGSTPVLPANDSSVLYFTTALGSPLYLYSIASGTSNFIATRVTFTALAPDSSAVAYEQSFSSTNHKLFLYEATSASSSEIVFPGAGPNFRLRSNPVFSADGRYIALAANGALSNRIDQPFTDVFLYDRVLKNLTLISSTPEGDAANSSSGTPSLSADGRTVLFQSSASDLVANDRNLAADVFLAHVPFVDTDGDRLDDGWELVHFGDLSANAQGDADGDGLTNLQEFLQGSDPRSGTSTIALHSPILTEAGGLRLTWSAVNGKRYQLQTRSDLSSGAWQDVGNPVTADADTASTATAIGTDRSGFYRVRVSE